MTTPSLESLLVLESKESIYEGMLDVARALGLPVSSWQAGDPTRSQLLAEAEALAARDANEVGYIKSGFLDDATGMWLKVVAYQFFGITVPEATFASTEVVLTNGGGGFYPDIEPGDLTFKNSTTGKTYTNTTGGTLASGPGTTLTVTVVADERGSDSSASAGEIDEMVTAYLGVTCTNPTAAIGVDEQDEEVTRQQCRERVGRTSPNGPKDAYSDVARDTTLTGLSYAPRVRTYGDSDTGIVTVYLANASGGVPEADRAAVELAILEHATPLCITPSVLACTAVPVAVTYTLWIYKRANKTTAEIAEAVEEALEQMVARQPIGGDIIPPASTGSLYRSLIESTIRETFAGDAFRVSVATPSSDIALTNGQVATLGTVTATVHIIADPT